MADDITATITLRDGVKAQRYIFGTGGITTPLPIHTALSLGYRAFDTAQQYGNESILGQSIKSYPQISSIPREELFIISKVNKPGVDVEETFEGIRKSVEDIGLGWVDLFLVHNPNYGVEGRKIQWAALERAKKEGLVRSIGVSNFGDTGYNSHTGAGARSVVHHLEGMKDYATELPSVNQSELHPWNQDCSVAEWCAKKGIILQATCPVARGQKRDDEVLQEIVSEVDRSWNKVLLRYSWQKRFMVLCKSENPTRITDNAEIYDFSLSRDQMARLDSLDGSFRVTPSALKSVKERLIYYEGMP